jgi:mRNA interferase MazF
MSQDVFNARSETVIVMAVTSKEPGAQFPLTLDLPLTVLPKRSWVKIGQVRTISIDRLERKLGRVGDDEMAQLLEGLNEILGA